MDSTSNETTINAKMTSKNQITLPKTVRNLLNISSNDTVKFTVKENGDIVITKSERSMWDIVREQEAKYGSFSTPAPNWGPDIGTEVFD